MAEPTKLPATEYPATLLAISDLLLEHGHEAEANLMREIAAGIVEMIKSRTPPEFQWWVASGPLADLEPGPGGLLRNR